MSLLAESSSSRLRSRWCSHGEEVRDIDDIGFVIGPQRLLGVAGILRYGCSLVGVFALIIASGCPSQGFMDTEFVAHDNYRESSESRFETLVPDYETLLSRPRFDKL